MNDDPHPSGRSSSAARRCSTICDFGAVKDWKAAAPGRKAIGYMPIYVPRELIHAAGMLPVGILGGGDQLEVIQGDAYYQSYICRIPRSTIELGLTGRLDCLDGMLFPSICDVIRNLSGMWQILFKDKYVRYFDVPQNYEDAIGGKLLHPGARGAARRPRRSCAARRSPTTSSNASIRVYNDNRAAVRELYAYRAAKPWQAPTSEVYLRAARRHGAAARRAHGADPRIHRRDRRACRGRSATTRGSCINGSFCEQPPLGLIKSIEMSGCYIVDDDFMLVTRWLLDDVPADGHPLEELVEGVPPPLDVDRRASTTTKREDKGQFLLKQVKHRRAPKASSSPPPRSAIRRCSSGRCCRTCSRGTRCRYTAFKYAENTGQMAPIREQAGTFADSIKLWSAA